MTLRALTLALVGLALVAGCGSDPDPEPDDAGPADAGRADAGPPVCTLDETQPCFDGDPAQAGVGACTMGIQICTGAPPAWGRCVGSGRPALEACGNGMDEDCDGAIDAADADCPAACPAGPAVNDTCDQAQRIAAFGTYAGTVAGAADDIHHLEAECTPPDPAPDVIYFVDLPRGMRYLVSVDDGDGLPIDFTLRGMSRCEDPPPGDGGCGAGFGSLDGPSYLTVEPNRTGATCFTLTIEPSI